VQQDGDLEQLIEAIKREFDGGKLKYVLVGGPEIGTRSYQDDYQIRHVHVAAIFNNRTSKRAILKNWNVKQGNGYYLVPRNRDLPYKGWRDHHIKPFSKVSPEKLVLYEAGDLPKDTKRKRVEEGEEEKKPAPDPGKPKQFQDQSFGESQKKKMFDLVAGEEQQALQRLQNKKQKTPSPKGKTW
jgi:hypothetical protein